MGSPRYSWMVVVFPLLERIVRYCGRSHIVERPYYIFLNLSLVQAGNTRRDDSMCSSLDSYYAMES